VEGVEDSPPGRGNRGVDSPSRKTRSC
jgi:hypothetical protein